MSGKTLTSVVSAPQAPVALAAHTKPARLWLRLVITVALAAGLVMAAVMFISAPPTSEAAAILAPTLTLSATPPGGTASSIPPGGRITYTLRVENTSGTFNNVVLTDTLPAPLQFVSATPAPDGQSGNIITWTIGTMTTTTRIFTLVAQLPTTQNVLRQQLLNRARVTWTGGSVYRTLDHYVRNADLGRVTATSINITNNGLGQAVAGELVTVTVYYTIPQGTIAYVATPRLLVEDSISLTSASDVFTFTTSQTVPPMDPQRAGGRRFTLMQFPSQTITDTDSAPRVLSYTVYAVQRQRYFLAGQTGEVPHNTGLLYQPILRWCDAPGCSVNPNSTIYYREDETNNLTFVRPDVRPPATIVHTYLDSAQIGQGGGGVRFTIANTNQAGRPPAYDMVVTATLGSGLTYVSSNGGTAWMQGGLTYITWTVPGPLNAGQAWTAYVTATLPGTFIIGTQYTCTSSVLHQTFAGNVPHEGVYINNATPLYIRPGLATPTKQASPNDNVKIGDTVTYTVVTRIGAGTILYTPSYTDTLPKGFHYVTGTLQLQGVSLTGVVTAASATKQELLKWFMTTVDNSTGTTLKVFTATYRAELSGLDTAGQPVYAANSSEIKNKQTAANAAVLYWPQKPAGATYQATRNVLVAQPYLRDNFSTSRTDTPYQNKEIGGFFNFQINFRNTTAGVVDAYDVHVCDTLPQGLAFGSRLAFGQGACARADLIQEPVAGAEGTICWIIDEVCPAVDMFIQYQAIVQPTALPGDLRSNRASIADYSSQKGGTNDGNGNPNDLPAGVRFDRHYSDFPAIALPDAKSCTSGCPFTVLGLAATKTTAQTNLRPGDRITYTLRYTDTSNTYNYTGMVITDTYDTYLTYVSATPAPTAHDTVNRKLLWNIGTVPANGGGLITLVMQVKFTVPGTVNAIANTMEWDSDQTIPLRRDVVTSLGVPNLHVQMSGPATTNAGGTIAYTVVYSNNGSGQQPVTLTLNYGPYLVYQNSNLTPKPGTDNVFVDNTLPNNGSNRTLTIQLAVRAPLPYTLDSIHSDVTLSSVGAPSVTDDWTITLNRPIISLDKQGPSVPSGVGQIMQYTIRVKNNGSYTATALVFTDTWGAKTSYNIGNTGSGWTDRGSYATYAIAQLGIGQEQTFYFLVNVDELAVYYTNTIQMSTNQTSLQSDEAQVWQKSLATTKSANPDPAFPGRVLTYTIYYTNTGGDALGTIITDHLPSGFIFQGSTVAGAGCQGNWTFQQTGQDAVWTCPGLASGAQGQLQIWGMVNAAENTWFVNATEGYAHGVRRPIQTPLQTRVARPWLAVTKSADLRPVAPGDRITYTLVYSNYGSDTAHAVVIKDNLPTQVNYVSCAPAPCTHANGVVSWNRGEVPTGTLDFVTLVVQVKNGTAGQTIVNSAYTIESSNLRPADTTSGPAVTIPILAPHLSLSKTAPRLVSALNEPITYTLAYTNDGGGKLTNVIIADNLSTLSLFESASSACSWTGSGVGGVVTCIIGTLEQGESGSVFIRVLNATQQPGSEIVNQAQGDSDQTEPITSNSTSVWYNCIPVQSASFTSNSPRPVGQGISFNASYQPVDARTPITYTWSFGGAGTGSGLNGPTPVYTYTSAGTYTVTLSVDNPCPQAAVQAQPQQVTATPTARYIYLPLVLRNY